jgi:hypothetical protein
MDGFDLGLGVLFPFAPGGADRDAMMNSIAPIWDDNETWLVLGGVIDGGAVKAKAGMAAAANSQLTVQPCAMKR